MMCLCRSGGSFSWWSLEGNRADFLAVLHFHTLMFLFDFLLSALVPFTSLVGTVLPAASVVTYVFGFYIPGSHMLDIINELFVPIHGRCDLDVSHETGVLPRVQRLDGNTERHADGQL